MPTNQAVSEAYRQANGSGVDTHPKEQFVHHNAGHGGFGGSSYIDAVILRDDHEDDWTEAADSTLERRVYYCQNWRADVVALLAENGRVVERAWYEPYGTPHGMSPADFSGTSDDTNDHYLVPDGDADADDAFVYLDLLGVSAALSDMTGSSDPGDGEYGRPNGTVDSDDYFYYLDVFGTAAALGRNVLSAGHDGATASHGAGNLRNRRGLAGYEWDPHVRRYQVRNRVLYPEIGRWTRRDPLGYVDGSHLFECTRSMPMSAVDPLGLFGYACDAVGGCDMRINPGVVPGTCVEGPLYSVYTFGHLGLPTVRIAAPAELYVAFHRAPFVASIVGLSIPSFPVHGNWCGPGHGGSLYTCDDSGDPIFGKQKCRYQHRDHPDPVGLDCPALDCTDRACMRHDICMYASCINWRFGLFREKSECHKVCDCSFCSDLRGCAPYTSGCNAIKNWAMRKLFCQFNGGASNCHWSYDHCKQVNPFDGTPGWPIRIPPSPLPGDGRGVE